MLLKPTDLKNDQVLLSGYSPGGHSLVSDDHYFSAIQAASIVGEMGLGSFSQIELGKALTGKVARVSSFIAELSEGVRGSASPKDLETMFQLLYLRFTGVHRDPEAFQAHMTTTRGWLENQEASPSFQFSRELSRVTFQDHLRRNPLTLDRLDQVDLDRAIEIYRDRFADASDFLFTLVGNFDLETIRPLVETWVGGLPAIDREETWRDVGAFAAPRVEKIEVKSGIEPRSQVRLTFHGDTEWSYVGQHIASSMGEALRIRLREVLREDLGGVYGVGVFGRLFNKPRERYNVGISFACDPERVEELLDAVFTELRSFVENGPDEELLGKVREIQRRSRETATQQNRFWLSQLDFHEREGLDLTKILDYDQLIEAVTVEAVQDAAKRYLDEERYILGVLYPEEGAEGP